MTPGGKKIIPKEEYKNTSELLATTRKPKKANDPPEEGKEGTFDIKCVFNTGGDEERRKAGVPMNGVYRWNTTQTLTAWAYFFGYSGFIFVCYWWAIYSTYHVFLS